MFRAVREKKHTLQSCNALGESIMGLLPRKRAGSPDGTHTHES